MKNDTEKTRSSAPKAINQAVQRLLQPLVKLLLSFQITYPVVQEWLKKTMVEVADRDFKLESKPQTDTRLSLLTGIHRKDIKRLRGNQEDIQEVPEAVSLGVQIAAHWMAEHQDQTGQPLVLPFKHETDPSFEALVEKVSKKDIRARVVLDEWLRLGVVNLQQEEGEEKIQLMPNAFVPKKGIEEKAFFAGMNLADHIATVGNNLLDEQAKFERCMYYDGLSPESIDELKTLAAQESMDMLTRVNQRALELKEQDAKGENTHRINLGVYLFDEDQGDVEDQ